MSKCSGTFRTCSFGGFRRNQQREDFERHDGDFSTDSESNIRLQREQMETHRIKDQDAVHNEFARGLEAAKDSERTSERQVEEKDN